MNQTSPVTRIGLDELEKAAVDWEKLDAGIFGEQAVNNFRSPKEHQTAAINAVHAHFQNNSRGKLIMACGTGKTYTSLKIAENPFDYICVCSDETVSRKTDDEITRVNLPMPATTDPNEIVHRLGTFKADRTVIFSTYQSIDRISEAQKICGAEFDLIICDEAHRTTGYGSEAIAFTKIHDQNFIRGRKRLYMTATPRLYTSDAKKKAADNDLMLWSMDDAEIYGDEFYHLGFDEAVENNLLSDYKVLILTVDSKFDVDEKIAADDTEEVVGCINAFRKKLTNIEILGDPAPMKTAVGFCARINDSKKLAEEFNAQGISAVHVDGKMSGAERNQKLSWLKATPNNDCWIITNARCLSEGNLCSQPRRGFISVQQAFPGRHRSSRRTRYAQGSR